MICKANQMTGFYEERINRSWVKDRFSDTPDLEYMTGKAEKKTPTLRGLGIFQSCYGLGRNTNEFKITL